jgi:hypothetical protein
MIAIVKERLRADLVRLCQDLGLEGRPRGNVWQTRNPRRADRHGGSFTVWIKGASPGAWKDFASGDKGDVLDLVCYLKGLDRKEGLAWCMDRYGLRRLDREARRRLEDEARAARRRIAEQEREQRNARRKRAHLLFARAAPHVSDTVMAYLAWRGLALPATFEARWCRSFERFEWWPGRDPDTGERGPEFPAMVWGFVDGDGKQQAVHITCLAPDGRGKAPVTSPKLIWPEHLGLVVRVARGETGLSPEDAARAGQRSPVVITEGIEDALTIANAAPELRVWCAGSLAGYGAIADHPCVSGFILARDNDWGKPQAARLFDRAVRRLAGFGKPVRVIAAAIGKDFNDQWRAA